jgi:hypothetical protein
MRKSWKSSAPSKENGVKRGQSVMMPRHHPETMKIIATKAQRHQGFTLKKPFV